MVEDWLYSSTTCSTTLYSIVHTIVPLATVQLCTQGERGRKRGEGGRVFLNGEVWRQFLDTNIHLRTVAHNFLHSCTLRGEKTQFPCKMLQEMNSWKAMYPAWRSLLTGFIVKLLNLAGIWISWAVRKMSKVIALFFCNGPSPRDPRLGKLILANATM